MSQLDLTRQLDIFSGQALATPITVIGAGGIGAPTVLFLAKMGMQNLTVWDDDTIEEHNLPNTLLPLWRPDTQGPEPQYLGTIGEPKAKTLAGLVHAMAGHTIAYVEHTYPPDRNGLPTPIVISGIDSMAGRRAIWTHLCKHSGCELYIDARMAGEYGDIFAVYLENRA